MRFQSRVSPGLRVAAVCVLLLAMVRGTVARESGENPAPIDQARERGQRFERALAAMDRLMRVWLTHADRRTLLLPDRVVGPGGGLAPGAAAPYTPHNSGADLYPYLILTASLTDPGLYHGRMMEMLRNEVRYTSAAAAVPGNLDLATGKLGAFSLFGAGEYAKDGLITVTEYLGRTPWYARMVYMIADALERGPVESRFGKLPALDSELNGDYLQVLARLGPMTGDQRFVDWARRIADAYIEEVLPGNHGVPSVEWDFAKHTGVHRMRLRDHGNEMVVGLVLQFANEVRWKSPRAEKWRPVIARMLDRILESANEDGLLYDEIDAITLKPVRTGLADNWGYVYGAAYTFYQCTGETKYRDAVLRVLRNLPKYRRHVWEPRNDPSLPLGSFDGYADTIESALYLVAREPVPEALDWIESEMQVMLGMQRPDGHIEYWYGEGNFNRTAMLYALMQSRGVRPAHWRPGMRLGAAEERITTDATDAPAATAASATARAAGTVGTAGTRLYLSLAGTQSPAVIQFDYARHRRVLNLDRNYVRLNEFPEWFVVDENTLYRVRPAAGAGAAAGAASEGIIRLGSELIAGIELTAGDWLIEPAPEPAAPKPSPPPAR